MVKLFSSAMLVILLLSLFIMDAGAIPTRDKQAVIEELNAYGLDVLDHYPSREPTTADDYYKVGLAYLFRSAPQAAAEQFRKALELNPNHVDSLIGLAITTAQMGDREAALEHAKKVLKIEPNKAKVYNTVGAISLANAQSLKHLEEAEANFRKALSLEPNLVSSRMNLARLYISMRKPESAIKEYEAVIKLQPENLSAHAELARAYLYVGSLDKATEEAEKTVKLSPNNPVSRATLGTMYARKGQFDKALEEFEGAIELEPTYALAYKNIGYIRLLRGSPDEAIEEYKKALSYRPNYGEAYSGLGDAYVAKGKYQEAAEEYEKAIDILPVSALISVPAYNNLAYIYAEKEQELDKALSLAQKAKQLDPKQPDISDTIGWIYYKKGMYDEAVANLRDAIEGSPDNPIIRYHLGAAYHKQGANDEAAVELRKGLSMDDKFDGAEDARRLLSELESR